MREEIKDLKNEAKEKKREHDEKVKDLAKEMSEKKKEFNKQQMEMNQLRKKKVKEGTIEINRNLSKKTQALKTEKINLLRTIDHFKSQVEDQEKVIKKKKSALDESEETASRYRRERDDARKQEEQYKKTSSNLKQDLEAAASTLRKLRLERMNCSKSKASDILKVDASKHNENPKTKSEETSNLPASDAIVDKPPALDHIVVNPPVMAYAGEVNPALDHNVVKPPALAYASEVNPDLDHNVVNPALAYAEEITLTMANMGEKSGNNKSFEPEQHRPLEEEKDKGSKVTEEEISIVDSTGEMEDLDEDDSFMNPPVAKKKYGKNLVKNYEKIRKSDVQPTPSRSTRSKKITPKNYTATSLNNHIFFIALGEKGRAKHDVETLGIKKCGLFPYCSNLLRGGEDIALVYIISPEFHDKYEQETWACYYHAEASMNGIEKQLQGKVAQTSTETPKNSKVSKKKEVANKEAPRKIANSKPYKKTGSKPNFVGKYATAIGSASTTLPEVSPEAEDEDRAKEYVNESTAEEK